MALCAAAKLATRATASCRTALSLGQSAGGLVVEPLHDATCKTADMLAAAAVRP